jgi:hypothetical protein
LSQLCKKSSSSDGARSDTERKDCAVLGQEIPSETRSSFVAFTYFIRIKAVMAITRQYGLDNPQLPAVRWVVSGLQVHAPQQVGEAWVGAQRLEGWVPFEVEVSSNVQSIEQLLRFGICTAKASSMRR